MNNEKLQLVALACRPYLSSVRMILGEITASSSSALSENYLLSRISFSRRSSAQMALQTLIDNDLLVSEDEMLRLVWTNNELIALDSILLGISIGEGQRPQNVAEIVLTPPKSPSRLTAALNSQGTRSVPIEETLATFERLAIDAVHRLAIITPFLDEAGSQFVLDLFNKTPGTVEKQLILRFLSFDTGSPLYPSGYPIIRNQLHELDVEVFDFGLRRTQSSFLETFHAKAILADNDKAYIGSSNFNQSSLSNSMELGVLIQGKAALHVGTIIDTIISISARAD